jgi:quercetin dioxygenase-like cupin family protein
MSDAEIIDSTERVCASLDERGLHVFDLESLPWEPPRPRPGSTPRADRHDNGVAEKWLVFPEPDSDRFPITIVRFPANFTFPRHWHTEGEFIMVLKGSMNVGERTLGPGDSAYNDARTIYGAEAAGPEGCEFLMIRRAFAVTSLVDD